MTSFRYSKINLGSIAGSCACDGDFTLPGVVAEAVVVVEVVLVFEEFARSEGELVKFEDVELCPGSEGVEPCRGSPMFVWVGVLELLTGTTESLLEVVELEVVLLALAACSSAMVF